MTFSIEAIETLSLLWRATWQSTVLALLVAVVILASRRWLAAKWRVVLWTLPLFRMLFVVVPASGLSIFNGISYLTEPRVASPILSLRENDLSLFAEMNTELPVVEMDGQSVRETSLQSQAFNVPTTAASIATENNSSEQAANRLSIATITISLWLLGCLVMVLRWGWSALVLRRTLARCAPVEGELWEKLKPASMSSSRLQMLLPARCLVTERNLGPATCGFFRPTILLPRQLFGELTIDQLRDIVRHEYQHIQRFDVLLLALSRCVTTMYWFNPVTYVISRILRREMELAVDAATIRELHVPERQAYGDLLIQLARRPASKFGLAQMADCKSDMKARIEAISSPRKTSPVGTAVAVTIFSALLVVGCTQEKETTSTAETAPPANTAQSKTAQETNKSDGTNTSQVTNADSSEQKYYVFGTVREAGTNKPIPGAEVQLLVEWEQEPEKRVPKGVSDAVGKYRIEVPMGNVKLWYPSLKPGYWLSNKDAMKDLVTSPEQPEVVHDIIAGKSPTWQVHAIGDLGETPRIGVMEEPDAAKRAAIIKGEQVTWTESPTQAFGYLDANGRGALTQVGTSGGLFVSVVNVQAELVVEDGFDNMHIVSADRLPDSKTTRLIDAAGKQATVTEATVTVENGMPLLTFQLKSTEPIAMQKLTGRVVDTKGTALASARVGAAIGAKDAGSSVLPSHTLTDQDGHFELNVPIQQAFSQNMQFAMIVTKNGYAGMDTQYIDSPKDFDEIDFGKIELAIGHSLPIQVVDSNGKPVAGATIEPGIAYSLRSQAVRSDANGRATLNNLPSGVIQVSARHGGQAIILRAVRFEVL